jgi:hypothetical protein
LRGLLSHPSLPLGYARLIGAQISIADLP